MQNATFIASLYVNGTWAEFIDAHLTYPLEFNNYLQLFLYVCLWLSFAKLLIKLKEWFCASGVVEVNGLMELRSVLKANELMKLCQVILIFIFIYMSCSFPVTFGLAIISMFNGLMMASMLSYTLMHKY